ncbi:filament-like plant protein 4-like isoform X1 [Hibiscus syriacus]|uniref:Filament-like plant protein 4-like isoform X1 n=1 Tax=Hibiscus syriacus TaxID=106335 RepID=A0A6A3C6W1_HIBSY|nr:filament-like plant protein 4-like isoform X1 [Hibiscus syriacus]
MSAGCSKIRHILRRTNAAAVEEQVSHVWWPHPARCSGWTRCSLHWDELQFALGRVCRRFVVRATYLNHPFFNIILVQAEEEYGFINQGPLVIPCDGSVFEEVIRFISRLESRHPGKFVKTGDLKRELRGKY